LARKIFEKSFLPAASVNGILSPSKRDALAPLLAAAGVRTVAANRQARRTSTLLRLHSFLGQLLEVLPLFNDTDKQFEK
jgi:hypothetical protein